MLLKTSTPMILEIEGEQVTYEQFIEVNCDDCITTESDYERVRNLKPGESVFIGITEVKRIS